MQKKKSTNLKRVERGNQELPSFLQKLTAVPEEIELPTKSTKDDVYLGSVFFGICREPNPPLHSLNLGTFNLTEPIVPTQETYLDDVLLPKTSPVKKRLESKIFHPRKPRRKKLYDDPFLHRCPGVKKIYKQGLSPRIIDFGETISKIVGETSREIPFCRLRRTASGTPEEDVEIVALSDLKEKERAYMSDEERLSSGLTTQRLLIHCLQNHSKLLAEVTKIEIFSSLKRLSLSKSGGRIGEGGGSAAHFHFPKEFTCVQVIGPKIPASILITKIPSKRRKLSEYNYKVISKISEKEGRDDLESELIEELEDELTELTEDEFFGILMDQEAEKAMEGESGSEEIEEIEEKEEMEGTSVKEEEEEEEEDEEEGEEEDVGSVKKYDQVEEEMVEESPTEVGIVEEGTEMEEMDKQDD